MTYKKHISSILAVLGSIASILGLLAQVGIAPILAPLKIPVGIPLWLIFGITCALPWIVSRLVRHSVSELAERLDVSNTEVQSLREVSYQLEQRTQERNELDKRLCNAETRLLSFESLESELLGFLNDGGEHDLSSIVQHTSLSRQSDGAQRVLRVISTLEDRIEGTGGFTPKYQRKKP